MESVSLPANGHRLPLRFIRILALFQHRVPPGSLISGWQRRKQQHTCKVHTWDTTRKLNRDTANCALRKQSWQWRAKSSVPLQLSPCLLKFWSSSSSSTTVQQSQCSTQFARQQQSTCGDSGGVCNQQGIGHRIIARSMNCVCVRGCRVDDVRTAAPANRQSDHFLRATKFSFNWALRNILRFIRHKVRESAAVVGKRFKLSSSIFFLLSSVSATELNTRSVTPHSRRPFQLLQQRRRRRCSGDAQSASVRACFIVVVNWSAIGFVTSSWANNIVLVVVVNRLLWQTPRRAE